MHRNHSSRTLVILFNRSQASIGRDSTSQSLFRDRSIIACSCHVYMGVILRAHSVRGESRIHRNASGEVATSSPPFYNEPHRSQSSFCEGCTWHDVHILVITPFCCDRKARAACAQSFTLWQQATIEIMRHNHSSRTLVILFNRSQASIGRDSTSQSLFRDHSLVRATYCICGCYSWRTSCSWWIAHSTQRKSAFASEKPEIRTWGAKLASCPGRHLTS